MAEAYDYEDHEEPNPKQWVVAVYELDRHYGGSEEGGWWYNTGALVRIIRVVRSKEKAYALAERADRLLYKRRLKKRRQPGGYKIDICSMAYCGGHFQAEVHPHTAPPSWSGYHPYS